MLTFAPAEWDVPQTVAIAAVEVSQSDGAAQGTVTVSVDTADSGRAFSDVPAQHVVVTMSEVTVCFDAPGPLTCSNEAGCGDVTCDDGDDSTHTDLCQEGQTTCAGSPNLCRLSTDSAVMAAHAAGECVGQNGAAALANLLNLATNCRSTSPPAQPAPPPRHGARPTAAYSPW